MGEFKNGFDADVRYSRLTSFSLLIQFIMGLAFTSAVIIFLTGGESTSLRVLSSYSIFDLGRFLAFLFGAVSLVYSSTVSMSILFKYVKEFQLRQARLFSDYVFNVIESLIFVALSLTLGTKTGMWDFFYIGGVFLGVDALFSLFVLLIGTTVPIPTLYTLIIDVIVLVTGITLSSISVPHFYEILVGLSVFWAVQNLISCISGN